jgi:hypothetical protein
LRARIALLPSTWRSFENGVLTYDAAAAGRWRLTVRRVRGPVLLRRTGATMGGVGRLRLRRALPRGDFDIRLVLTTATGGVVQARARIVTRRRLTVAAGRSAVARVVNDGDGDGGDGWETQVGRCEARRARHVACRVEYSWYSLDESGHRTCQGWADAWLRRDGVRVADDGIACGFFESSPTAARAGVRRDGSPTSFLAALAGIDASPAASFQIRR